MDVNKMFGTVREGGGKEDQERGWGNKKVGLYLGQG